MSQIEQEIAFIGKCTRSLLISYYVLECIMLRFYSVHLTSVKLSVIFPLNALRFIDMRKWMLRLSEKCNRLTRNECKRAGDRVRVRWTEESGFKHKQWLHSHIFVFAETILKTYVMILQWLAWDRNHIVRCVYDVHPSRLFQAVWAYFPHSTQRKKVNMTSFALETFNKSLLHTPRNEERTFLLKILIRKKLFYEKVQSLNYS